MDVKPRLRDIPKNKLPGYIWEYYRWHIIVCAILLISAISLIKTVSTARDPEFSVMMINNASDDTAPFDDFLVSRGIEYWEGMTRLTGGFFYNEDGTTATGTPYDDAAILAHLNAGSEDVFFGTGQKFINMAKAGYFKDLRDYLPKEVLAEIPEEDILYCRIEQEAENTAGSDGENAPEVEEYPCAVIFKDREFTEEYYPGQAVYGALIFNAPHQEAAGELFMMILGE